MVWSSGEKGGAAEDERDVPILGGGWIGEAQGRSWAWPSSGRPRRLARLRPSTADTVISSLAHWVLEYRAVTQATAGSRTPRRQVFSEFSGCGRFYLHRLRRRQVLRSPRLDFSGFGIVREVRSWILFCICGGSHMYIVSGGADKRGRQYLSK